jgi:hypothetical protein
LQSICTPPRQTQVCMLLLFHLESSCCLTFFHSNLGHSHQDGRSFSLSDLKLTFGSLPQTVGGLEAASFAGCPLETRKAIAAMISTLAATASAMATAAMATAE